MLKWNWNWNFMLINKLWMFIFLHFSCVFFSPDYQILSKSDRGILSMDFLFLYTVSNWLERNGCKIQTTRLTSFFSLETRHLLKVLKKTNMWNTFERLAFFYSALCTPRVGPSHHDLSVSFQSPWSFNGWFRRLVEGSEWPPQEPVMLTDQLSLTLSLPFACSCLVCAKAGRSTIHRWLIKSH